MLKSLEELSNSSRERSSICGARSLSFLMFRTEFMIIKQIRDSSSQQQKQFIYAVCRFLNLTKVITRSSASNINEVKVVSATVWLEKVINDLSVEENSICQDYLSKESKFFLYPRSETRRNDLFVQG